MNSAVQKIEYILEDEIKTMSALELLFKTDPLSFLAFQDQVDILDDESFHLLKGKLSTLYCLDERQKMMKKSLILRLDQCRVFQILEAGMRSIFLGLGSKTFLLLGPSLSIISLTLFCGWVIFL